MNDQRAASPLKRREICAIVVTHHPDDALPVRLELIAPQVDATYVVDNGSAGACLELLQRLERAGAARFKFNAGNLGIARALNMGVELALADGHAWALLLDQDSRVDADIIAGLSALHAGYTEPRPLAMIGARFRDTQGQAHAALRTGVEGAGWDEVENVITSGCFLSLAAYRAVGPFRDEFFIDYVDIDYCYRARRAGYRVIESKHPYMAHAIGAPTEHRWLGLRRWTTNHSADRRYYMARNDTVLLRERWTPAQGSWRRKSFFRCCRLVKRIVLYETAKVGKVAAVAQGWWDGLHGNLGPRRR